MSAHLAKKLHAQLLAELAQHERLTLKAIGRRHGVSRQTLSRLRAELLRSLRGKMPLEAKCLSASADMSGSAVSTSTMSIADIEQRLQQYERHFTEIRRYLDALEQRSIELPDDLIALLDAAAAVLGEGCTRHDIACMGVRVHLAAHPELFCTADQMMN